MAVRETRASWRRLLFFFACIALGVAAIVTLRSVVQSVRAAFRQEARGLVAADVLVSTNRPWSPEATATLTHRFQEFGVTARTETVELSTMVRAAGPANTSTRMVELRAVEAAFPLYGALTLADGTPYRHTLLADHGVLVRPELLEALHLSVGDAVLVGQVAFTIRGVIADEPGRRVAGFSLGPRIIIDLAALPDTGLLVTGSRARRQLLVRVPEPAIEPLVAALHRDFTDEFITARSYRASDDELGRDFDRAEDYLSLVGLVVVILGGISVSSVVRVFIQQKLHGIAVLKCLGASSAAIAAIYLLQVTVLGLAGSVAGLGIARGIVALVPRWLGSAGAGALADVQLRVTWSAAMQGVVIGIGVAVLFSLVPLLRVRAIKPARLLRDEASADPPNRVQIAVTGAVALALLGLASWQADSWRVGVSVAVGFAALALVLYGLGALLTRALAPLAASRHFILRHAVLRLSRAGNQTRVVVLAVGLGAFFIVGVRSLQTGLLRELSAEIAADAPDMFLVDVQRTQVESVRAFLEDPTHQAGSFRLIPVLRARITGVEGRETTLESFEDVRARGSLSREYTVTYRDRLEGNERLTAGRFWSGPSADPEVSIEQGIHDRFRIDIGDRVRFDILGRLVTARVSGIREVDWKDSRNGGFMFVFRPGVLEGAPQTFIAPVKGPAEPAARARFQHDLVAVVPNVSVIDFREILATVRDVLDRVTLAITLVGALVMVSGVLILIGAVAMTKYQRVREAAIFKTLGATSRRIGWMLTAEYAVLGVVAGGAGSLGAVALTWGVSRYALEMPWRLDASAHVWAVVVTAVLVAMVGVVSSLDVLRHKPLETLRSE